MNPYEPPEQVSEPKREPVPYPSVSEVPEYLSSRNDWLAGIMAISFLLVDLWWLWS